MNDLDQLRLEIMIGRNVTRTEKFKRSISMFFEGVKDKIEYTGAVITGKHLPYNEEYVGATSVSQDVVESDPRRWVIEECVPACQVLWSKNIYTFMCSDPLDINAWIEIRLDSLSEENLLVLEQIKKKYNCYQYHAGCINISVRGMGKGAQEELVRMASMFAMQDVPDNLATMTIDEILMRLGCCRRVKNPNYEAEMEKWMNDLSFSNWGSPAPQEYDFFADRSLMTKSEDEYIRDFGAIKEGDKIYISKFHYDKHLAWLKYKNENISKKTI